MYFAENIRFLRENMGMTQGELAKSIGEMSQGAVGNWEAGRREPDIQTMVKIAAFFDVTLDDLILRDLKPPAPLHASNIRYLREKHGMAQEDMANLLGYRGKRGYEAIEAGKADVTAEDLEKISDFFGITPDRLVKQDLTKGVG